MYACECTVSLVVLLIVLLNDGIYNMFIMIVNR